MGRIDAGVTPCGDNGHSRDVAHGVIDGIQRRQVYPVGVR